MHITILTQYYPPETGAPQRRLSDLAQRISAAGHNVTILTAMPNYPTGKIFEGYRGLWKKETLDGIKVIRALIFPTQKTALIPRLANYFSFVFFSALVGTFFLKRTDYLLVESPPLFLGISAYWLSRLKHARLIFNVSDLWPESAVHLNVLREGSWSHRLGLWLERFCYRKAWLVTGQSKSILDDILQRFPTIQTFHLSNGANIDEFSPAMGTDTARKFLAPNGECTVLYAGLHGIAQGLDQVVEAARHVHTLPNVRFVLIGDGPERQALIDQAEGLHNIHFLKRLPAEEIPRLVASADIVLVPLKLYIPGAVPSKLYEAMACGKPVILIAEGEAAAVVEEHNAGLVVKPGQLDHLVSSIRSLAEQEHLRSTFGSNGRKAIVEHYDRNKIAERFLSYLESS